MAKPKHASLVHPPSQAALSSLALIATIPPVVAGAPLHPPAFLCPFIERDILPDNPSTSIPTFHPSKCDVVADRFVQGSDSLWRKTDSWTLYGSTCGSNSAASTSAVQPQTTPSQSPIPTNALDMSVLPAGWKNATTVKSNTESTIILALAIVLAGLICLFMIGCVIWRRKKRKARDIERKLGHTPTVHHDAQIISREEDARGRMRLWAKATARWKSNVRQSARRRRKRHCLPSTPNRPLSPTLSDSLQLSLVPPSAPSRQGSVTSVEPEPSRPQDAVLGHNGNVTESPGLLDSPRSVSPPTYGASFVPRLSRSPSSSAVPDSGLTLSAVGPYSVLPSFIDDEPLPYVPPSDGHVATDDKSQLAHIRQLASSPPTVIDVTSTSTMQSVSAPEWHEVEDDLEDLGTDSGHLSTPFHDFSLPPSFPPPPSNADIPSPFRYLDDCPLDYGDGHDVLVFPPVPTSPRTSLGAFPSAPSMDDHGLEPSAPSLEDEDELFQDWYGPSSCTPGVSSSADQSSAPVRAIESSIVSSVSRASFPSIPESAGRDGTLPLYQP